MCLDVHCALFPFQKMFTNQNARSLGRHFGAASFKVVEGWKKGAWLSLWSGGCVCVWGGCPLLPVWGFDKGAMRLADRAIWAVYPSARHSTLGRHDAHKMEIVALGRDHMVGREGALSDNSLGYLWPVIPPKKKHRQSPDIEIYTTSQEFGHILWIECLFFCSHHYWRFSLKKLVSTNM